MVQIKDFIFFFCFFEGQVPLEAHGNSNWWNLN